MSYIIRFFLFLLLFQLSLSAREVKIDKLIITANLTAKTLLIWLHKPNCGYCSRMEKFTLKNDRVKQIIDKEFLFVHLDVYDNDKIIYQDFIGSTREFAIESGFDFYPTTLFFDKDGEIIYEAVGYHEKEKFIKVLQYISTNRYLDEDFDMFYKNK